MYIALGQEHTAPQGTKFWCQQELLVTSVICCQFQIIDDNSFWKIHCFTFFLYKSIWDQIWPCRKIGQGQPRVIIWANLVVLKHPMMHTMIQGQWPFGSGEEDLFRFLPYMAMAASSIMWPGPSFPYPIEAPYVIWLWLAQWFLRRRCLKNVDDDVWRTTEAYLSYKLTIWAFGSGELKIIKNFSICRYTKASWWKTHFLYFALIILRILQILLKRVFKVFVKCE